MKTVLGRIDGIWLGEDEEVVVALQVAVPIGEAHAAILGFAEAERLDQRPHRAVEDEDALCCERAEGGCGGRHC